MNVRAPHALVVSVCLGLAASNAARLPSLGLAAGAVGMAGLAAGVQSAHRTAVFAAALACAGWWWGSVRLAALDHSVLSGSIGTAERARLEVTALLDKVAPWSDVIPSVSQVTRCRFAALTEEPLNPEPRYAKARR